MRETRDGDWKGDIKTLHALYIYFGWRVYWCIVSVLLSCDAKAYAESASSNDLIRSLIGKFASRLTGV